MPFDSSIKKVLVIGSGPIVIGQAAEFDYAGTQACRVLKAEGVSVVLANSNPATIMTDNAMADAIYLEPLTTETIKRIIEKERPDSILASLGGQTGLTIAMQLHKEGYLEEHGIRLPGHQRRGNYPRRGQRTVQGNNASDQPAADSLRHRHRHCGRTGRSRPHRLPQSSFVPPSRWAALAAA